MKRLILAAGITAIFIGIAAQAPQGFNYQAILRNADGGVKVYETVALQINIVDEMGATSYMEVHNTQTNQFGLVNVVIGKGTTSGDFSMMNWAAGPYFIDITVNGENLGSNPLLSVPYALYAESGNEGPQGPPGMQGIQGEMGPIGPKGDKGDPGPQGIPGAKGEQGEAGAAGPQGEIGPTGEQGEIGPVGPQGEIGPKGEQGIQGLQGLQGPQGPKGDKGDQGEIGPQGEPGDTKWKETPEGIFYNDGKVFVGTSEFTKAKFAIEDESDVMVFPDGNHILGLNRDYNSKTASLQFYLYPETNEISEYMRGSSMIYSTGDANDLKLVANNTDGTIQFHTSGWMDKTSERMRITSNGNVGIGTSQPNSLLHVKNASPRIVAENFDDNFVRMGTGSTGSALVFNEQYCLWIEARTDYNTGVPTSKGLMIQGDGNIGIGTAIPTAKLDVNGNVIISGNLTVNGNIETAAHSTGESYGGGIVFYITPDGKHGLIAAIQDQSTSSRWYDAFNIISNPANYSTEGQKYIDWRLPTKYELDLMYQQKSNIGGFANAIYWSATENDYDDVWEQNFSTGIQGHTDGGGNSHHVRAIRSF